MESRKLHNAELKGMLSRFGFSAIGIAKAEPVDSANVRRFKNWLDSGMNGSMNYMSNNVDKRLDPCLLLPSARSVIVVALNYYPAKLLPAEHIQFAYYAYGKDYHDVMRRCMSEFAHTLQIHDIREKTPDENSIYKGLICCDTVPVLDRYWAWKSGIGWIGKNTSLIVPGSGSFFFLGEIITELECDEYDSPMQSRCGGCNKCMDACPTGALCSEYTLDSRRCLSYLTIENRGNIPSDLASKVGDCVYGCDRCQKACPHNRFSKPTSVDEFMPSEEFLAMERDDWHNLSRDDYQRLFCGSAVKRARYEGLKRNIDLAKTDN